MSLICHITRYIKTSGEVVLLALFSSKMVKVYYSSNLPYKYTHVTHFFSYFVYVAESQGIQNAIRCTLHLDIKIPLPFLRPIGGCLAEKLLRACNFI